MSDELMKHGHSAQEPEYENEDLGTRGIYAFLISLVVSGIVIYFIIVGMYRFLDRYERSQMTTSSPLVPLKGEMSRLVTKGEVDELFKDNGAPMLEINERGQFRDFLLNQEDQLNSYDWVDEKAGVVRIPIERAMELTVQRGLPVYAGSAAGPVAAGKISAQKSPEEGKGSAQ
jgi:hypothetical protein